MPQIHEIDVDEYLYDSVRIEPLALEEEYVRMPMDLAYWNQRYSDAVREFLTAKVAREKTLAYLYIKCREDLIASHAKPTEKMVDAAVAQSDELDQAHARVIDAEVEKSRLGGVVEAVRSKRDMLISLGAHIRAEFQREPSIKQPERK